MERGRRASIGGLDDLPVWEVARFREKPNPDLAEHFISQGNFLWNAGMFIWTIPAIFSELSRHCPVLADFVSELRGSKGFSTTVDKQFGKLPKLSIDYALMAVSYTHLDVYKRQAERIECGMIARVTNCTTMRISSSRR